MKEKYSLVSDLRNKDKELVGDRKLSMIGVGDFPGMNNTMRATMNVKHISQALTIDKPEFPYIFNGNENVMGANSSFYIKTDKSYKVIKVIKKYNELLKGRSYFALYFFHCDEDDSYYLVERKECENLTEDFGFDYRNDYLDATSEGDEIPSGTVLYTPTSYDEDMNVSTGVNGLILYATDPAVQDDAIIISESFSKRMVSNQVTSKTIPVNENTIFVNLYGDDDNYQGLPNIGDIVTDGVIAATRQVKETRMFSDLRDSSLGTPNFLSDQIFHGDGEIVDINIYCNNPNLKLNKVNSQLIQYWNDLKFFYSEIYRTCRKIVSSGSKLISKEINYWLRRSMEYLDSEAKWDFNDNIFSNLMVQILVRKKEQILVGRKLTGRAGNKSIVSKIVPDEEMPYITSDSWTDEYGRVHPSGEQRRIELITNPLAIINRTIPMVLFEASITFILTRIREYMGTLDSMEAQVEVLFRILEVFNKTQANDNRALYDSLSERQKREYVKSTIEQGIYIQKKAFDDEQLLRDSIIQIYEEFDQHVQPYNLFVPKKKWNRDIFVGKFNIGYQYIMLLKQSGEKGFSVRAAGAISDESLPEKSNENKISREWHSSTPIRFGEYESPNFMIITEPEDFALITALYRSSIDGRRFLHEAILSEDGNYDIPKEFTSRSSEILQVYLKSLGVRMETVIDDGDSISEPEDMDTVVAYTFRNNIIFATPDEMYHILRLARTYRHYRRENPDPIIDFDEAWDWVLEHLPFKKKHLTDKLVEVFKNNIEVLTTGDYA